MSNIPTFRSSSNNYNNNNVNTGGAIGGGVFVIGAFIVVAMVAATVFTTYLAAKTTAYIHGSFKRKLDKRYGELPKNNTKAALLTATLYASIPSLIWAGIETNKIINNIPFLKYNLQTALGLRGDYAIGVTLKQNGKDIVISKVRPEGPAAKAGMRKGDIIYGINRTYIEGYDEKKAAQELKVALNNDMSEKTFISVMRLRPDYSRSDAQHYTFQFVNPQLARRKAPNTLQAQYYIATHDAYLHSRPLNRDIGIIAKNSCVIIDLSKQDKTPTYFIKAVSVKGVFEGHVDPRFFTRPTEWAAPSTCEATILTAK